MYLGYVDGEWVELIETEEVVDADTTLQVFSYIKDGETIVYYKR